MKKILKVLLTNKEELEIMGIRFLGITLLLVFTCFGQGIETQRKYGFDEGSDFASFVRNGDELAGFSSYHHADLRYFDLYFDTPNFDLAEKGYSLRMRKKEAGEGGFAYVFQLKSEMETTNGVRMEVEETELDFYYLFHKDLRIDLAQFLDLLFGEMQNLKENGTIANYQLYLDELARWIEFKAGAPLVPFQKLHFLMPDLFSIEGIKKLRPVLIGQSVRSRSHIYLSAENNLEKTGEILINKTIESQTPEFFKTNPKACWLFESSLDESIFYPLFPSSSKSVQLWEYEVENKLPNPEKSLALMREFETHLKTKYGIFNTLNSKYLQSILAFRE